MTQQCEGPSDPHCSLKQYVPVPVTGTYMVFPGGRIEEVIEAHFEGSYSEGGVQIYRVVVKHK